MKTIVTKVCVGILGFGVAIANSNIISQADIEKFATVMAQIQHYYI